MSARGQGIALLVALAGCGGDELSDTHANQHAEPGATPAGDAHAHGIQPRCDSTWAAIRHSIFEAKRCTAPACHGAAGQSGQLDLESDGAYANLIHRPAAARLTRPLNRVTPGEQSLSLLYLKLAAATHETSLPDGAGAPMPVGEAPLTDAELTAVKLWIRAGAPERGVVAGTQELLDCAQSAHADPNKAPQPPVPAPTVGFQHAAGPWTVEPNAESEVCFATYYDLTDSAPDWARIPCTIDGREQTCVAYDRRELSQDAQSHHSGVSVYAGEVSPSDAAWGRWRCAGGALAGTPCDPLHDTCGAHGVCQAAPRAMVGCTAYGPDNKEVSSMQAGGSQAPLSAERYPAGVYSPLPIKGIILWNSHGFNLTEKQTTIEQYNTFWYARPEQRRYVMQGALTAGAQIPSIEVPPYTQREYCSLFTLPRYARLSDLSSHTHKRGIRWRTWLPPHPTTCPSGGCLPDAREPEHQSTEYNDPVTRLFDPPLAFDQEDPAERTLAFCALYDNGRDDPGLLKRKNALPKGASCLGPLYCAGGEHAGRVCQSDGECAGGQCDACTVMWGATTEDEMFFLLASYYVVSPAP